MLIFALLACGDKSDTAVESEPSEEVVEETEEETQSDVDTSFCQDEYALCGKIVLPEDFTGTTANLAVALYETIPPAGPPSHILTEISGPEMTAGDSYQIAVHPVLATGEYYLWFNLYMDGGGEWVPVNGVDYTGFVAEPLLFSGPAVSFEDISLEIASGW